MATVSWKLRIRIFQKKRLCRFYQQKNDSMFFINFHIMLNMQYIIYNENSFKRKRLT